MNYYSFVNFASIIWYMLFISPWPLNEFSCTHSNEKDVFFPKKAKVITDMNAGTQPRKPQVNGNKTLLFMLKVFV